MGAVPVEGGADTELLLRDVERVDPPGADVDAAVAATERLRLFVERGRGER